MKIKTISKFLAPLAIGIALIVLGFISMSNESSKAKEANEFKDTLDTVQRKIDAVEYKGLSKYTNKWLETAKETNKPDLKWKSLYNAGRTNLEVLEKTADENSYRAGRRNFREALRENPDAIDAKYNLTYLEDIAQKRGIKLEEIPAASNEPGNDPSPSTSSGTINKEDGDERVDLQDEIVAGKAPGLVSSPPLDITNEIDPEEIPQKPQRGF